MVLLKWVPVCLVIVPLLLCLVSCNPVFYNYNLLDNGYYYGYKTDTGQERHEQGTLKSTPTGQVPSVSGSYEYELDGIITVVTYVADEKGFRPIIQLRKKIENQPLGFTLDNRIDPKLLGSLAGGGLG